MSKAKESGFTRGIGSPSLYYAVVDSVKKNARSAPISEFRGGRRVLRSVDKEYGGSPATALGAITSGGGDSFNRVSGRGPVGERGASGVYISPSELGLTGELGHYAKQLVKKDFGEGRTLYAYPTPPLGEAVRKKTIFEFQTKHSFATLDLTGFSAVSRKFLDLIFSEPGVKAALRDENMQDLSPSQILRMSDYSASAGLGNSAVENLEIELILFGSARVDSLAGENGFIVGEDGVPLTGDLVATNRLDLTEDKRTGKIILVETPLSPADLEAQFGPPPSAARRRG